MAPSEAKRLSIREIRMYLTHDARSGRAKMSPREARDRQKAETQ
jgi:hypothetical protein